MIGRSLINLLLKGSQASTGAVRCLETVKPVSALTKFYSSSSSSSSSYSDYPLPEVQKPAPNFSGVAVVNGEFKDIKLSDFAGKYLYLFFYPLDFTFVCPTEIIALSDRIKEFHEIETEVVGVSCDSQYSHLAWINLPRKEGGLGPLKYPLLADYNKNAARNYNVLIEEEGVPLRGSFLIDPKGIIRQITINDLPVGRSVDEVIRVVKAFQFTDKHGEVCPANWNPDKPTIKPTPNESKEYFNKVNK